MELEKSLWLVCTPTLCPLCTWGTWARVGKASVVTLRSPGLTGACLGWVSKINLNLSQLGHPLLLMPNFLPTTIDFDHLYKVVYFKFLHFKIPIFFF